MPQDARTASGVDASTPPLPGQRAFMLNAKFWRVRRITALQYIREGRRLPWWLGLAYWEWDRAVGVCYPVPFNLVVRWARSGYFWVKATHRPDWFTRELEAARQRGYDEARQRTSAEVRDARRAGYDEGVRLALVLRDDVAALRRDIGGSN